MAANVQDVVMFFGDSITQGAWEPGFEGTGAHLARESRVSVCARSTKSIYRRCLREEAGRAESRIVGLQYRLGGTGL